jgi:hypothetical protein
MQQIAARLGFDLVTTRLEIYGRKPAAKQAAAPARPATTDEQPSESARR